MRSMENPPRSDNEKIEGEVNEKEISSQKAFLDLLNKARQGTVEHEDVYWHVFGKGSSSGAQYPDSLVNRPDLLAKFAVGKNNEPYHSTKDAAHDLIEYLASEAEGKVRQEEEEIKQQKVEKEIDAQKELLDLLNKARQGTVEHEDVYWHVFGKGSSSGAQYPDSLVNRPDLLARFAVGKNNEPYHSTKDAAHDLIEYLAREAEGKIKELTIDKTPEAPSGVSESMSEEKKLEETPESIEESFRQAMKEGTTSIPTSKEKKEESVIASLESNISEEKPKETTNETPETPPPSQESALPLEDLRDLYLKAKRLRGNVFRGGVGRLFRRKLNFGKEEMDFGGKEGADELERVRAEYQEKLSRYRLAELKKFEDGLKERLARGEIKDEDVDFEVKRKIISLLSEEQENINQRSVEGIEKNIFEKMKIKWRQYWKERLGLSLLLGGLGGAAYAAGTGGTGIVAARVATGSVGTYIGVEAGLERWTKLVGHKGLVSEISKEKILSAKGTLEDYVATLPPEEIKKEAARLRMLQVEKGVSLDRLSTSGDNGKIAAMIIRRDNELTAEEAIRGATLENATPEFADRLSARLSMEINSRNEVVESEVDKERIKKMARKTIAALAGGTTGWLIGGKLIQPTPTGGAQSGLSEYGQQYGHIVRTPTTIESAFPTPPETVTASVVTESVSSPVHEVFNHIVTSGENLWKIIEANLDNHHIMDGLGAGARTHMIDALKDVYDKMPPEALKALGFASGDANLIQPGEILNLSATSTPEIYAKALSVAKNLSAEDITTILKNNAKIAKWLAAHHQELKGALNSATIDKILQGAI